MDGVGKKLGFGLSRLRQAFAEKGERRLRALWLLPASAGLMVVAAAAFHESPVSRAGLNLLMVALKDPFALLSQRSPGHRSGPLVAIKGKTGPRERVLSTVRERPPVRVADISPVVLDLPVVVDIPPGTFYTPTLPTPPMLTPGEIIGPPFLPTTPFSVSVPGFTPGETPPPLVATNPPEVPPPIIVTTNPPPNTPPLLIPGGTPDTPPVTPPGTPPGTPPVTPPGTPPEQPGGPIILPEPSSLSMMIMGLIATAFVLRRRKPG